MKTIPTARSWSLQPTEICQNWQDYYNAARDIGNKAISERDAEIVKLNKMIDALAQKVGIYCPVDEACQTFRMKGDAACGPCKREWAEKEVTK